MGAGPKEVLYDAFRSLERVEGEFGQVKSAIDQASEEMARLMNAVEDEKQKLTSFDNFNHRHRSLGKH